MLEIYYTLLVVIMLFVINLLLLAIKDSTKFSFKTRFKINFSYKLIIYLVEILFMFSLFQLIIMETPIKDLFSYDERSFLKRFIDFFTVYQIFIFIVLNLYDSLDKEVYLSLLHQIEHIQPYLDENKSISSVMNEVKSSSSHDRYSKYDDISLSDNEYYIEFLKLLKEYDDSIKQESEITNDIKFKITLFKATILEKKERNDSLWNLSLYLRLTLKFLNKKSPQ
ncbi:hypothetical protein [Exiguobacterium sp. s102]|uniref:hypothetical protein n=1 Tax=Exiguobacterium sp. s102 TaxID=2751212 RepID=UPI001BE9620D|nr:hypothetical protein [Exiguobacterium sp. s102]